jgi:hypothetical protein
MEIEFRLFSEEIYEINNRVIPGTFQQANSEQEELMMLQKRN